MTFGVLCITPMQAAIGADIYWTGHSHDTFGIPKLKVYRDTSNQIRAREVVHIRTGGLKREGLGDRGGWAGRKGILQKPTGAYWLRFQPNPVVTPDRPWAIEIRETRA